MSSGDVYKEVKTYFQEDSDVEVNAGRGAQGIKYKGKMFAMFYKGDLVVKLSPQRIAEVIEEGLGQPFDPGTGKAMKDRVLISTSNKVRWIDLCLESKDYVMK